MSLVLSILVSTNLQAQQNFGDPKFYLLDSLDLTSLSEWDKLLIDTSLTYYHQAKHDTTKLDWLEHIVDECWNEQVWPRYNELVFLRSYQRLLTCRIPAEQEKYASLIAGSISNKGYVHDNQGDIEGALNYYHKALNIYERIGDFQGAAASFNNLGVLYSSQGDTSKALVYHNESLRLKRTLNDKQGISLSLNNIGTIYKNRGRVFEALDCFEKSLRICRELDDHRGMAISYDNIAGVYFVEGYPLKAIDYYQRAYEIRLENGEYSGASFSVNNIASVMLSLGRLNEAEAKANESMRIAAELGYPIDVQNAAEILYKIYKAKNDFNAALRYHELYVKMRDSLYNSNNERAMLAQALKYEYEKESLKDSLENSKIQAVKDSQINAQEAVINQEKTLRYALLIGLLLMIFVVYQSVRNYRQKQKDNELIQEQKAEVERQKIKVEKQHQILEDTYKEISDSISYAKRIQQAILPPEDSISSFVQDSFVWYQPKNVVSGDFFWMEKLDQTLILAVADCTGHGVPGAMVSVVCHNAMNRAVMEFGLREPAEILNKTRELVIATFDKSSSEVKDGMDICLISLNLNSMELNYAGANNNLYIIRENLFPELTVTRGEISLNREDDCTFIELKADKQPIGRFAKANPFSQQKIQLQPGDQFFLFSDGLADQFGGPKGKKFKYQQFKELLIRCRKHEMSEKHHSLVEAYENWKGDIEQVDDICIIGCQV